MLGLLKAILETITMLINFLINIIVGLIQFITMIPTYFQFVIGLADIVPPFASVFFTAGITLTIMLFLINREEVG